MRVSRIPAAVMVSEDRAPVALTLRAPLCRRISAFCSLPVHDLPVIMITSSAAKILLPVYTALCLNMVSSS